MNPVRRHLIIHAGFPKCASSTIQVALRDNADVFSQHGFHLIGEDFTLLQNNTGTFPIWMIEELKQVGQSDRLRQLLSACTLQAGSGDLILSAENLGTTDAPGIFAGLSDLFRFTFICYFRPQSDFICSAWKQWNLKVGHTIEDMVRGALDIRFPDYLGVIRAWQKVLGDDATFHARPLVTAFLKGGHPFTDFLHLISFAGEIRVDLKNRHNPSLDYALLHTMLKGHRQLFEGIHDNSFMEKIESALPESAKKTNVDLLTYVQRKAIELHFFADTFAILTEFSGIKNVPTFYDRYFAVRRSRSQTYPERDERRILRRCRKILASATRTTEVEMLDEIARQLLNQ